MNWIELHKAAKAAHRKAQIDAENAMDAAERQKVRVQHPDMTDAQFAAAYDYAWQEGHAYGYHEVASKFDSIADVCRAYAKEAKP